MGVVQIVKAERGGQPAWVNRVLSDYGLPKWGEWLVVIPVSGATNLMHVYVTACEPQMTDCIVKGYLVLPGEIKHVCTVTKNLVNEVIAWRLGDE